MTCNYSKRQLENGPISISCTVIIFLTAELLPKLEVLGFKCCRPDCTFRRLLLAPSSGKNIRQKSCSTACFHVHWWIRRGGGGGGGHLGPRALKDPKWPVWAPQKNDRWMCFFYIFRWLYQHECCYKSLAWSEGLFWNFGVPNIRIIFRITKSRQNWLLAEVGHFSKVNLGPIPKIVG